MSEKPGARLLEAEAALHTDDPQPEVLKHFLQGLNEFLSSSPANSSPAARGWHHSGRNGPVRQR